MTNGIRLLIVLASTFSGSAFALDFNGRCSIAAPPVHISIDLDPRANVDCRTRDKKIYLFYKSDIHVSVGTENYVMTGEWEAFSDTCKSALAGLKEYPSFPFLDARTGISLAVQLFDDKHAQIIQRSSEAAISGCVGSTD